MKAKITIEYCTQCKWLMRASWMASEFLTTFVDEIEEVALKPGTGGVFTIHANHLLIFSRKERNGFLEITELKQMIRDQIAPGKSLGHSDKKESQA